MANVGIVAIGDEQQWAGAKYYLQHLIKCVATLPSAEYVGMRDIWWRSPPENDPFLEVRSLLGESTVVSPPTAFSARILRKLRRTLHAVNGARDLFAAAEIDIFFPAPPCENSGTPYVWWLADFQYLRRPDLMSAEARAGYEAVCRRHVGTASRIVLSSEDAQRDFATAFPEHLDRTNVVRFCSVPDEFWWKLAPIDVAQSYGLPDRFLIVCNQFTRYKNHLTLIKAIQLLERMGQTDVHLVCTGSTFDHRNEDCIGTIRRVLKESVLESRVHVLGLIPRAAQIALLRRSVAVVQPSWFEGWSTIVEDAKTLGKAILVSDLPVHREQLGESHAHYLSLDDEREWADAILSIWCKLEPGPDTTAEIVALEKLKENQRACGLAFVSAIHQALGR